MEEILVGFMRKTDSEERGENIMSTECQWIGLQSRIHRQHLSCNYKCILELGDVSFSIQCGSFSLLFCTSVIIMAFEK